LLIFLVYIVFCCIWKLVYSPNQFEAINNHVHVNLFSASFSMLYVVMQHLMPI